MYNTKRQILDRIAFLDESITDSYMDIEDHEEHIEKCENEIMELRGRLSTLQWDVGRVNRLAGEAGGFKVTYSSGCDIGMYVMRAGYGYDSDRFILLNITSDQPRNWSDWGTELKTAEEVADWANTANAKVLS